MRFNNSYELANYFVKRNNDTRQWGELRGFENSNTWRYYFWDMQDKYVRGKSIIEHFFSAEYREAEEKCISNFIDYIDKRLTFPLDYIIPYINGFVNRFLKISLLSFCIRFVSKLLMPRHYKS